MDDFSFINFTINQGYKKKLIINIVGTGCVFLIIRTKNYYNLFPLIFKKSNQHPYF